MTSLPKKIISRLARICGYEIKRAKTYLVDGHPIDELSGIRYRDLLSLYFASRNLSTFYFVQIGAHNGVSNVFDVLHEFVRQLELSGLLVEPQADVFHELKENYRGCRTVRFENAAVAHGSDVKQLYTIRKDIDFLQYVNQAASFDSAHITRLLKHHLRTEASADVRRKFKELGLRAEDCLEAQTVQASTFDSLLEKHGISRYDLLQIDTEGFDYEVIKMARLEKYRPSLVNYEHEHLSEEDRRECWRYLIGLGYHMFMHHGDTTAYLVEDSASSPETARTALASPVGQIHLR